MKKVFVSVSILLIIIAIIFKFDIPNKIYAKKFLNIDIEKAKSIKNNIPKDILESIVESRDATSERNQSIRTINDFKKEFLYKYENLKNVPDYIEVDESKRGISVEGKKAVEDVEYIFKELKYGYAGYKYFGGDEKFLKAKENILIEFKKLQKKNGRIECNELEKVMCENLDFIQDGHFSIGGGRTCKESIMYTTEKYEVIKKDNSYFLKLNNDMKGIVTINKEEPEKYIKPSIDENGNIVYRLCRLYKSNEDMLSICLKFKDGNKDNNISINLENTSKNHVHKGSNNSYKYEEVYKIPVIDLNSFEPSEKLEKFVEDGKKISKKDLVIIDLRGNYGGNEIYAFDWIKNFTNQEYKSPGFSSTLLTKNSKDALLYNGKKMVGPKDYPKFEQQLNDMYKNKKSYLKYIGWSEVGHDDSTHINNEKIIFVLMDKNTASAGESFVKALKSCSNTFFIGTNTSGMSNIGDVGYYVLPNSKIDIFFGNTLFVDNDLEWRDGLGVLPDFWVNSKDEEYRLLKFIKNYSEGSIKKDVQK
ncbi:hypothetical protein KTC92_05805 [Clostridium sp. CM027]|uniref:S41 family peptidase n=1 Tax=Clostridium sp. CM027 TaxID=2849865 RepID=UPI001C6E0855|nr:S41 family peptidase [Clostridium sp. CM027]MBW9146468.1 hypothetical protein [Clostridium sp. CM027]UVE41968.1 hypothetical protein KTC92_05805 [Clostridium sp. CM027]